MTNPSTIAAGSLDSEHIGPYSRWQGNLDAELVVIGQDFADVRTFMSVKGWPGESVPTNLDLVQLVQSAGIKINAPKRGCPDNRLFFTNAVLCLKGGTMGESITASCSRRCGERFLRPTIRLIAPRAVVALGTHALDALLAAFDLPPRTESLTTLIESGRTYELPCGKREARVFPMCHPSRRVQNTIRSLELQKSDWARLGHWLRAA